MKKESIMIVEDEYLVAMDIESVLKKAGYDVSSIETTGEKAVESAAWNHPDLVLMDITLAGEMNGMEAADIIRRTVKIPVVFLTAHNDRKYFEEAKRSRPFGYIIKPYAEHQLLASIEVMLYKAKRDREHEELLEEKEHLLREREKALDEIRILRGILPICAHCHKIRDDTGLWERVEDYIRKHSEADFSHGLCPDCISELYPDM